MRIGIEKLVKGYSVHEGNHTADHVVDVDGNIIIANYYYHGNLVCTADLRKQIFKLDSCGYYGHNSTMQTLSQYRNWFTQHDYLECFREEWYMLKQLENLPVGNMLRCYLMHTESGYRLAERHLQVTYSAKQIDKDKYATVTFASEDMPYPLTVEFKYRGVKTFNSKWKEKVQPALDNYLNEDWNLTHKP